MSAARTERAHALPLPGDVVDRYETVAELAQGGMAVVLAVRRRGAGGFDKLLAMKMMLPHLANERRFVEMFLDEARIAARIHHANVVQVLDVGEHRGLPFMIMELLAGRSLADVARHHRDSGVSIEQAAALLVLTQAADGLAAAHETRDRGGELLGIVHRDLTPQNIHVGYDGRVKILDFGIAAASRRLASATQSGELRGTYAYLAPEQITRETPVDARADIWAFGVVAWELLTGRRLFADGDSASTLWNVVHREVPPLRRVAPDLPKEVCACITACLARDREQRPPTAREIADIFARAVASTRIGVRDLAAIMQTTFAEERRTDEARLEAATTSHGRREPRTSTRTRRVVALTAAAVLMFAGAVALVATRYDLLGAPRAPAPILAHPSARAAPPAPASAANELSPPVATVAQTPVASGPVETATPARHRVRPPRAHRTVGRSREAPLSEARPDLRAPLGNPY